VSELFEKHFQPRLMTWALALYGGLSLVSMATMSIGAGCVALAGSLPLFAWTVNWLKRGRPVVALSHSAKRMALASILLTAACALSLICEMIWPLKYAGLTPEVHFAVDMLKSIYLFWPFALSAAIGWLPTKGRERILQVWIYSFLLLSVVGFIQYYIGWPRPHMIPHHEPRFHTTGFLGHHLSYASIFIFPFFVTLGLLGHRIQLRIMGSSGPDSFGVPRRALVVAASFGLIALITTFARTLWIGLPIGLLIWLLWSLPKKLAVRMAGALVLLLGATSQIPIVKGRLLDAFGLTPRMYIWTANIDIFKHRPWTGSGWHHNLEMAANYYVVQYGSSVNLLVSHAHNNVLEVLSGTGCIGFLAWAFWNAVLFSMTFKLSKRPGVYGALGKALFCAWIVFHINGMTQVNFWESKVLHQMMWVIGWTLIWLRESESREPA